MCIIDWFGYVGWFEWLVVRVVGWAIKWRPQPTAVRPNTTDDTGLNSHVYAYINIVITGMAYLGYAHDDPTTEGNTRAAFVAVAAVFLTHCFLQVCTVICVWVDPQCTSHITSARLIFLDTPSHTRPLYNKIKNHSAATRSSSGRTRASGGSFTV